MDIAPLGPMRERNEASAVMGKRIRVVANADATMNVWAWTDAEPQGDVADLQIDGWVSSYTEVEQLAEPGDEIDVEPGALDQMASFGVGRTDAEPGPT